MAVMIGLIVILLFGLPTAAWFFIGARRAQRVPRDQPGLSQPTSPTSPLGAALARQTTYLD